MVGSRWGRAGAGFAFLHGDKILLLKRSAYVLEPGMWGLPGGAVALRRGKPLSARAAAKLEAKEELGTLPRHEVVGRCVFTEGSFTYTTYIARVRAPFVPSLNWENDRAAWVSLREVPRWKLHPGVRWLLDKACFIGPAAGVKPASGKFLVTQGGHGRLRIVAPGGGAWERPGPMVPTPRVRKPASAMVGPAKRSVQWSRRAL